MCKLNSGPCDYDHPEFPSQVDPVQVAQEIRDNFKNIVGIEPVGEVKAKYVAGKFTISDIVGVHEFDLHLNFKPEFSNFFFQKIRQMLCASKKVTVEK